MIEQAWVLQLKDEFNELDRPQYFADEGDDELDLVDDLRKAERYKNKEVAEHWMKRWEEAIFEKFGEGAICNAGYTNMMKHFDWVEIEVEVVE